MMICDVLIFLIFFVLLAKSSCGKRERDSLASNYATVKLIDLVQWPKIPKVAATGAKGGPR